MDKEVKERLSRESFEVIGFPIYRIKGDEEKAQKLNDVLKVSGVRCYIENDNIYFMIASEDYIRKTTRCAGRKRNKRTYDLDPTVKEVFDMYHEEKSLEKVIKKIGCPATTFYLHWNRVKNQDDLITKDWVMEQKFFKM